MIVSVNGEEREVADNIRLDALLATFDIQPVGIAVEVNQEVVPKRLHPETIITNGDKIEIIRMVGGG
jgi:sulfur carrier protein